MEQGGEFKRKEERKGREGKEKEREGKDGNSWMKGKRTVRFDANNDILFSLTYI